MRALLLALCFILPSQRRNHIFKEVSTPELISGGQILVADETAVGFEQSPA